LAVCRRTGRRSLVTFPDEATRWGQVVVAIQAPAWLTMAGPLTWCLNDLLRPNAKRPPQRHDRVPGRLPAALEVSVPRRWLRRSRKRLWYCPRGMDDRAPDEFARACGSIHRYHTSIEVKTLVTFSHLPSEQRDSSDSWRSTPRVDHARPALPHRPSHRTAGALRRPGGPGGAASSKDFVVGTRSAPVATCGTGCASPGELWAGGYPRSMPRRVKV
jgi:hypothetical protein